MSDRPPRHIFLDVGTTNARAWLVADTKILARASASVGVRDTARDGTNDRLQEALKHLIDSLISRDPVPSPILVMGAGMISSSLGLADVPHVLAPASLTDLAGAIRSFQFPDITPLPILLVPGVRTGNFSDPTPGSLDLMRGEETLCLGLLALGKFSPSATVLNLGSHWKAIQIDSQRRIAGSITTLSGEMIYAVQSATILASAIQQGKPSEIDDHWVALGMTEQRAAGLARAMFCVRLLEQQHRSTPQQRMAFLLGAFIASDLDALVKQNALSPAQPVILVGAKPLARAWQDALAASNIPSQISSEDETEAATIGGLNELLLARTTPV